MKCKCNAKTYNPKDFFKCQICKEYGCINCVIVKDTKYRPYSNHPLCLYVRHYEYYKNTAINDADRLFNRKN